MEAMFHSVMKKNEEEKESPPKIERPWEEDRLCHCGTLAIKLRRMLEDRPEERQFWTCRFGQCEFFEWGKTITHQVKPPTEMSFALVKSEGEVPGEGARRRSKSPRTEKQRFAAAETVQIPDDD